MHSVLVGVSTLLATILFVSPETRALFSVLVLLVAGYIILEHMIQHKPF